jgi:Xylose isomerase-like TIM barrel
VGLMMATSVSAPARFSILRSHHPVGASTGYMYDLRGDWAAQVSQAWQLSPFAIELSALAEEELDGLADYVAGRPGPPFRYLSVHGPSKGRALPEPALVARLKDLSALVDGIVMHPDTIEDPAPYRALGRKLVLENMDARKEDGRSAGELARWFADLPEAGLCFDIAHAWSIDETMAAGVELLDAFRSRLRHLHVSSLSPKLHHEPLTEEHEELFMPLLQRCLDVPWILEAPPRES